MIQTEGDITIITATRAGAFAAWRELASYGGLFVHLFKEIAMRRFQDTILGPIWLLLRPLIPSIVAIIIFTRVVPIPTGTAPYPLFYFGGYIFWGLFASIVAFVPRAMRMNRGMMKKMYFPRLLIPMASLGIPLAELAVTACVLIVLSVYYWNLGLFVPTLRIEFLLIPFLFVLTVLFAVAVGMVAGVLSLIARDVLYTLPYFLQVWMLLTPVIYHIDFIPEQWHWLLYVLNPMASIVETGRALLLGVGRIDLAFMAIASVIVLLVSIAATMFFLRAEDIFMDDI